MQGIAYQWGRTRQKDGNKRISRMQLNERLSRKPEDPWKNLAPHRMCRERWSGASGLGTKHELGKLTGNKINAIGDSEGLLWPDRASGKRGDQASGILVPISTTRRNV